MLFFQFTGKRYPMLDMILIRNITILLIAKGTAITELICGRSKALLPGV